MDVSDVTLASLFSCTQHEIAKAYPLKRLEEPTLIRPFSFAEKLVQDSIFHCITTSDCEHGAAIEGTIAVPFKIRSCDTVS